MEPLEISTAIQISKTPSEVFKAIVDPSKMSNYFISESSGRMEPQTTVEWKFPEFEETAPVRILEVKKNEFISFEWDGAKGEKLLVEINLLEVPDNNTLVKITEGKMEVDEAGIQWFGGNTAGWANFLACLKAYLEYGINLRKGAFEFMRK